VPSLRLKNSASGSCDADCAIADSCELDLRGSAVCARGLPSAAGLWPALQVHAKSNHDVPLVPRASWWPLPAD
jgi:hypothetical protein